MEKKAAKEGLFRRLSRPVELTSGSPWRVILRYSMPITVSFILQQIYVLTDAIICGQVLTAAQVAGVNDTGPLTFIFLEFAFGCTGGFSVITAKAAGMGDTKGVRQSFAAQIYLSVIISLVLTVASIALLPWLLGVINVTPVNAGGRPDRIRLLEHSGRLRGGPECLHRAELRRSHTALLYSQAYLRRWAITSSAAFCVHMATPSPHSYSL